MSGYIHRVLDDVLGGLRYNQGRYVLETHPLSPTLYSVSIYCVRYQLPKTLGAWGYASSKAEAEELAETMESIFQMRYEHIKEQSDAQRSSS